MKKICISGATGEVGKLIIRELSNHVPSSSVTLTSRNPTKLRDAVEAGYRVMQADYRDRASLEAAYAGSDVLMMISGMSIGDRIAEHENAIKAAEKVGVKHIVYTSVDGVHPLNETPSAIEHLATERLLEASAVTFTALRNQMYSELMTPWAQIPLMTGLFEHVGANGLFNPVSREDIARCAATILGQSENHINFIYTLTGPEIISFQQMAQRFSKLYGRPIKYVPMTPDQMIAKFESWGVKKYGVPGAAIPFSMGWNELVKNFDAMNYNLYANQTNHVEYITGQAPIPLAEIMEAAKPDMVSKLKYVEAKAALKKEK